jgi:hypothetical protein
MIMVNLPHFRRGFAIRVGTTTAALAALRAGRSDHAALDGAVAPALQAHDALVRANKRLESGDAALFFAFFSVPFMTRLGRWVLLAVSRWLAVALLPHLSEDSRRALGHPVIAVDSSVPLGAGIELFGRFGFPAPTRAIWVHHTIAEDETWFVLQLGEDRLALREPLRGALPRAVASILDAARSRPTSSTAPSEPGQPTPMFAHARVLGLCGALRRSLATGEASSE